MASELRYTFAVQMVRLLVTGRTINRHFDRTYGRNLFQSPVRGLGLWRETRFLGRALRVRAFESQNRESRLDSLKRFPFLPSL